MINEPFQMIAEEYMKKCHFSFLPHPPETYIEMIDLWNVPKRAPPEDEWGFPTVEIYFQQEKNSNDDINAVLQEESISLLEAAHLILGLRISEMSDLILSKPIKHFYQKAILDIRTNKLKVEDINKTLFWEHCSNEQEIIINSSDGKCTIKMYDFPHGVAHYFKPHFFLDWALSTGLLVHEDLLHLIRVLPVEMR